MKGVLIILSIWIAALLACEKEKTNCYTCLTKQTDTSNGTSHTDSTDYCNKTQTEILAIQTAGIYIIGTQNFITTCKIQK